MLPIILTSLFPVNKRINAAVLLSTTFYIYSGLLLLQAKQTARSFGGIEGSRRNICCSPAGIPDLLPTRKNG